MDTTKTIKTFEDACKALNLDHRLVIPNFLGCSDEDREAMTAHAKLVIIVKALNLQEDGTIWKPDWSNWNERKYYPWFDMEKSSSVGGFSFFDFVRWLSSTAVGSRLCFKSKELAEYAGKQFKDLYESYFVIKS